jgi:Kef-type K+ transport system membrane component KefB
VVLAVVTGAIAATNAGTTMSPGAMGAIFLQAFGFLTGAVVVGLAVSPRVVRWSAALRSRGAPLTVSLALCFVTAYLSYLLGLAPIIGAFAAGLVLESADYQPYRQRGGQPIEDLLHTLIQTFVPVFFVLMGMHTYLAVFSQPAVVSIAVVLTAVAVVGKVAAGLGAGGGVNRLAVGLGMVPRGEVGLIFANIGLGLSIGGTAIVTPTLYSAIVLMVIVTTMLTPPALRWAFSRRPES